MSNRLRLDLALVLVIAIIGVALYPWGQRAYYTWLLHSPNPEQAGAARDALVGLGPSALPVLLTVAREDTNPAARTLAFEGVAESLDPRAQQLVLDIAGADWDQELQTLALQLLGEARLPEARPIFHALLNDADSQIRYVALRGAIATGDESLIPTLLKKLHDPAFVVAATAAVALNSVAARELPFPQGDSIDARSVREETAAAWQAWYVTEYGGGVVSMAAPRPFERYRGPAVPIPRPMAPDFTLQTLDGATLRLADLRGKPVLLNFWATWCAPCVEEAADLVAAAQDMGTDAVIVGIAAEYKQDIPARKVLEQRGEEVTPEAIMRLQTEAVHSFVREHGITFPNTFGDAETLDAYNAYAVPTTIIIRPDGTIERRVIGARTKEFFVTALRAAAG